MGYADGFAICFTHRQGSEPSGLFRLVANDFRFVCLYET